LIQAFPITGRLVFRPKTAPSTRMAIAQPSHEEN
jgi:hypothetical protein